MIENKEINRTFEKYPEYKDSGVEWLGEIPSHWEVKKMKFLGSIFPGLSGKKGDDFSKEFKADFKPFIPFTNICNNLKINADQYQYVHIGEFEVQNKVRKNDILFLMSSETLEDIGKCSLYNGENKELYLNSFCKGFRFFSNKLSTYFVNYLLHGQIYRNYFSLVGRGFTRINLKQEYINDAPIVLPLLPEQTTIATFLDDKTSKIDTAIAQKEKMIALLKERKQIIIQNAVTKGLDPNAKMKDSGVEWIGEIPEGWEILPGLRFIAESRERNIGMKRDTVLSLSYGNIRIKQKEELTGLVPESFETYQLVNKGDIIFRPTDLQNDKVSLRSSISNYKGIITSAYLNLRVKDIALPKYYHYLFRAIDNNKVIYGLGSGLRQNISFQDFRRFDFPFPSLNEQIAIANYLDNKSTKIDQAISLQQTQIEKLKEYKATLIEGR